MLGQVSSQDTLLLIIDPAYNLSIWQHRCRSTYDALSATCKTWMHILKHYTNTYNSYIQMW
jgi:hypothetical protein